MSTGAKIHVLVAEDEENLSQILGGFLRGRGHHVRCVADGRAAIQACREEAFDVALVDILMPELDGLEVLRQLKEEPEPPEVIIITGNGTVETAITAMKLGAYDYMSKPYRMAEIDVLVRRAWEKRQLARENRFLHARLSRVEATPEIVTQFAPMHAVLSTLERAAATETPVLITGESGTGKTLVARALHRLSGRTGPLIVVDCAALSESLLEIELFGHERGAFTGATTRKAGAIEIGADGTVCIDEVAALGAKMQAKLLRALEQASFFRIGGNQRVEVAIRLVAVTAHNLDDAVRDGRFHAELRARLGAFTVELPPLRERTVDIPLLADHFLAQFGGPTPPVLTPDAVALLEEYPWPGNVRELRNVMERAVLIARGREIRAQDLPVRPMLGAAVAGGPVTLGELERCHIEAILNQTDWHQGHASEALGISTKTLYRKIREFGLQRPRKR